MKKSKFSETQIVSILKEQESGLKVDHICRKHSISPATFYKWKSKYGGMQASDLKRMKELEQELSQYKKMYAELAHENYALKDVIEKKPLAPVDKKTVVKYLVREHDLTISQSCRLIHLSRSCMYRSEVIKRGDSEVIDVINQAISVNGRWGFWKCYQYSRLQGYKINHKRLYRVYCAMNMNVPRRTRKRLPAQVKQPMYVAARENQNWSMDFMHDSLFNGRTFRVLNIIDEGLREALAIEVDTSLPSARVVRVLERLKEERGLPRFIRVDNGPEFVSCRLQQWCEENHVQLLFIQPGKPTQNAYIERFNRTFRHELLNAYVFDHLDQVREMAWQWMIQYNEQRPHDALDGMTPKAFREKVENYTFKMSS
ncbi:IS3 family transposase [Marinicella sp. W31]|uniref:IS3 family transposase n=1 Tax=Marinicella sp. W31 TaxID=3023713 RepID=UPI003757AB44